MRDVLSWVDRHDGGAGAACARPQPGAATSRADVLAGILATDEREQSGIWSTASGVLAAYRSHRGPRLDRAALPRPRRLLPGHQHPVRVRRRAPPAAAGAHSSSGLLSEIREAAYERARGRRVPARRCVFALDEVANIAPLPDLPTIVSEGAGQGLLTLACLQDLSQARSRWGPEADGFLSLFGTTVVLPGIADVSTLRALSHARRGRRGAQPHGRRQSGPRPAARRLGVDHGLPAAAGSRHDRPGRPGAALAVDSRRRIGWVRLTPAHRDRPWRDLLGRARGRAPELFGR